jgi:hypothetical protein
MFSLLSWYFFSPFRHCAAHKALLTSTCLLLSATAAYAETSIFIDISATPPTEIHTKTATKQSDLALSVAKSIGNISVKKQEASNFHHSASFSVKENIAVEPIDQVLPGDLNIVDRDLVTDNNLDHEFPIEINAENVIKTPQVAINPTPSVKSPPASIEQDLTFSRTWEVSDGIPVFNGLLADGAIAQAPDPSMPSPMATESKKWAVSVHTQFSTTGFVGVDAGYMFSPNLHGRLGINTVGFSVPYSSQGIDYNASYSPTNIHLLGDYFPFGGGLRLTGGLVFQSNRFNASGNPTGGSGQINLGGVNYNASQVGALEAEGSFSNSVAPYLGIGFGTPLSPGLGFNMDAGVMFAGSPTVKLRANNISPLVPAAQQDQIRRDLAEQERRTNNDITGFNVFPVLSIGVSYSF